MISVIINDKETANDIVVLDEETTLAKDILSIADIDDLRNVDLTGTSPAIANNHFLVYNGTSWVHEQPSDAIISLGITADAAELNKLDGVTASTSEINYLDTTTLGTSEASKAVVVDANGDLIVPDSDKFQFGAGLDMTLYHDGTNSFITNKTGALKIATETAGIAVTIGNATSEVTIGDNLTVAGNLTVNGSTTTVNSTITTVDDPVITLGGDSAPGSDDNKDRGIEFRWHNGSAAKLGFIGYDDSTSKFTFIPDATNSSEVFSGTAGPVAFGAGEFAGDLTVDTSVFKVDSTNNRVGIGTASPAKTLHVTDTASDVEVVRIEGSEGITGIAGGNKITFSRDSYNYIIASGSSGSLRFETGGAGTNRLQIDSAGDSTFTGNVILDNAKALRLSELDSNGSHHISIKAPDSVTSSVILVLPDGVGTNGQTLTTNGAGVLSWSTISHTSTLASLTDTSISSLSSGHILVYDGSNSFDNVAMSGDATISASGVLTIAATSVEGSMLNTTAISGQTAMTGDLADADELMVSDGGTLKRADFSVVRDAVFNDISGDATVAAGGVLTIASGAVDYAMINGLAILDEDNMSTDSNSHLATQQSIKAYVDTQVSGSGLNIDGYSGSITSLAQDDLFAAADTSDSSTEKKVTFSNIEDAIFGNISGDATVAAGGDLTIATNAVEGSMLNTNAISGQTAMTGDLADTDELMVSDAGTLKRADFSVVRDAIFNDISGDATVAAGGALTIAANSVALSTDTTGNYVATLTAGAGLAAFSGGEGATETVAVDGVLEDLDTLGAAASDGQLIVATGAGAFAYESGATVRTSLGLAIGTNVQAFDAQLSDVAGLTPSNGSFIVGDGSNFVAESGATARDSLGLDTGNSPTFTSLTLSGQSSALSLSNQKLTSLGTPTASSDAATKSYVDSVAAGLDIYDSVKAASTASFTMASTASTTTLVLADGEGGFDATANTLTIDGISLSYNDRVLIKDGVDSNSSSVNKKWCGIYTVGNLSLSTLTLTRSTDMDATSEFNTGAFFFVEQGTSNADAGFVLATDGAVTVGTSQILFTQFSGAGQVSAGDALTKSGNTLNVAVDDSSIEVNSDALRVKATGITSAMLAGSIANSKLNQLTTANKVALSSLDLDGGTDIGADLVDADLIVVDDGAGGTNRASSLTRVKKYLYSAISGDATASDAGALTIATNAVEGSMLNNNTISGQAEMTGDLVDTDELMVSDAGTLKRADFSVVRDAVFTDVSGDATVAAGGVLTIAAGAVDYAMIASAAIKDEDNMASDSASHLATQQSIKAYVTSQVSGAALDIDGYNALGSASLHQTLDHFVVSDNGTEKKVTFSNLEDTIFSNISGDATVAAGGALTIADDAITYAKIQNISATDKLLGRSSAGAGIVEEIALTAAGRALLDDADISAQRTTLGLAIGSDVQSFDADLAAIAGLTSAADKGIQFTGSGAAATYNLTTAGKALLDDVDASAQRITLALGSVDSPQFAGIELGHATDTTIARASSGDINIEGNIIYRAGGTDVPVVDGGTGASTASAARTNLGVAIGSDVQAFDAQLADVSGLAVIDGNFIVGDGTNFIAESGNTARSSLGLGTGNSPTFVSLTLSGQAAALSMNSQKITGLATPTADADAASKSYVDGVAQGLSAKDSVRVATTANGTLASAFENGDTIDNIALVTDDRILIKNQTSGSENGVYTVNVSGAPTRAADFDSNAEVTKGAYVFVEEGTTNADAGFVLTTDGAITLDTTALAFTQFSGAGAITAGSALTKSGNTLNVAVDDSSIEVIADVLRVKAAGITNAMLAGSIANNNLSNSSITVTAGDGLSGGGATSLGSTASLALDLNELTAAVVNVANDSVAIIDANDNNSSRKESIVDLATGMSGTGLSAAAGQISIDATVTTLTGSQTLINKTLTSPIVTTPTISGLTLSDSSVVFEGATANTYETTLTVADPTADRTLTLPNSTDTLIGKATTDTLSNKTLTSAVLNTEISGTAIKDEDNMISDSASHLSTQQSIKAYVDSQVSGAGLDIDGYSALGSASLHQTLDHFVVSDNGVEKKVTFSNLEDTIFSNISGDAAVAAGGALTIAATSVEGSMLNTNVISGQTAMIGDLADTDELMISDAGTVKRADFSVVRDAIFNDVSGDATVAAGGALTIASGAVDYAMIASAAIKDEDNLVSDSAAHLATQQSIKAYVDAQASFNIDGYSALGGTSIHQTLDHFVFSDNGIEKKITFSNLEDAIFGNISGDATVAAGGALTIAATSVEGSMLNANVISGQTAMTGDLADTDELMISDAGVLKRADFSVVRDAIFNDISGDAAVAAGGALTIAATSVEGSMLNANVITGQTAETSIANDDIVLIYDTSATALRKMTKANFVSGLGGSDLVDDTTPQLGGDLDPNGNSIAGNLIPSATSTHDLGDSTYNWRNGNIRYLKDVVNINIGDFKLDYTGGANTQYLRLSMTANESGTAEPAFLIENTSSATTGGKLIFSSKHASVATNSSLGRIDFRETESNGALSTWGYIDGIVEDHGNNYGGMNFVLKNGNSVITPLKLLSSTGDIVVAGDLVLDDGGSIKEAGGVAAITISATGEVTKIGQDTPTDGQVLSWDNTNSKVVWSPTSSGSSITIPNDGTIGSVSDANAIAISAAGVVTLSAITEASAIGTAALVVAGGASIAKDLWVGDDIVLSSNQAKIVFQSDIADNVILTANSTGLTIDMDAAGASEPRLTLTSNYNSSGGPQLWFKLNPADDSVVDNDVLGSMIFYGLDDAATSSNTQYAKITSTITDASNNSETGKISFYANAAGTLNTSMEIEGTSTAGVSTVDISDHNGSTGGLKLGGTLVTTTAVEINKLDGGTSATSTTLVDADRIIVNDNGTIVQVALSDLKTYTGSGGSQLPPEVKTVTATTTLSLTPSSSSTNNDIEVVYLFNNGSTAMTANLPTAGSIAGKKISVKRLGTANVTIDGNALETIDGSATFVLTSQFSSVSLISDGTNWHIL